MRLFIATPVYFPYYKLIKEKLSKYIKGKWVEEENLHLTHKFIGEDDPKKYKIKLDIPQEKIKIKGLALFNNKILYLKAFHKDINTINYQINKYFNYNNQNFIPHVTLCRIKEIKDNQFFKEIKKYNKEIEIPFEVYLYKSTLTKNGPIYKKIYKY